jgi:hypothetical protein
MVEMPLFISDARHKTYIKVDEVGIIFIGRVANPYLS